jgi:predicted PurR-regulated permease PerM
MSLPAPSDKQARVLWFSLTSIAVGACLLLLFAGLWALGWIINLLSSVLLPLAVAGIIAYLLDPVVDLLEQRKIPRVRAILLVFFLAMMFVLILLATVVPQLVVELNQLMDTLPADAVKLRTNLSEWLQGTALGARARQAWDEELGATAQQWMTDALPVVSSWVLGQLGRVASWAGLLVGLALVPVYAFYFLLEKEGIQGRWKDFLPLQESKLKEEVVFVIDSINDCLIVFFRGQVLVAMCVGTLLTLGFTALGLNYAVLLGVLAGVLGIIPYLGVAVSLVPAVLLAIVQFGDWWHPLLVLGIFGLVQLAEGLFISPRIIGERVGLHPLTIIIAVMIGTTLLGGILGGVLAIPLTAALRTVMYRYVWKRPVKRKRG